MQSNYFFTFFLFLLLVNSSIAQYSYLVTFKDKGAFKQTDITQVLSERSLKNRAVKSIQLNETDYPVNDEYVQNLTELTGAKVGMRLKWLNAITLKSEEALSENAVKALYYVNEVKNISVKPSNDVIVDKEEALFEISTELQTAKTSFENAEYGAFFDQINAVNAIPLHAKGYTGKDVYIAVFDAGFRGVDTINAFKHIYDSGRMLFTKNLVDENDPVYQSSNHGTNVLSVIGSYDPTYFIGGAPDASFALFCTEDVSSESLQEELNWMKAAEICDSLGVNIINSSLGYSAPYTDTLESHTYSDMNGNGTIITRAADLAASRGILVVNSAGNEGNDPWLYITAPGDGDMVFTIGATDIDGGYAPFSSIGPTYDGRLKPNVTAPGWNVKVLTSNGSVVNSSGTSFSAPLIAGCAASLWQANTFATNMEVIAAIEKSASQFAFADVYRGYGTPDFDLALSILSPTDDLPISNDQLEVYPNPFEDVLNLRYFSKTEQEVNITLVNRLGKNLIVNTYSLRKGFNNLVLNVGRFPNFNNGTYLLKVQGESGSSFEQKVMRLK